MMATPAPVIVQEPVIVSVESAPIMTESTPVQTQSAPASPAAETKTETKSETKSESKQESKQETKAEAPATAKAAESTSSTPAQQPSVPKGKELVAGFGLVLSLEILNNPIQFQQIQLNTLLEYTQELSYEFRGHQSFLLELIGYGNSDNFFSISDSRWGDLRRHNDVQPCFVCD
jgi:hypothetical protein